MISNILFSSLPIKIIAYLDPGTGSLVIQVLIAAISGILLAVGIYWKKLKGVFRKLFKINNPLDPNQIEEDDESED